MICAARRIKPPLFERTICKMSCGMSSRMLPTMPSVCMYLRVWSVSGALNLELGAVEPVYIHHTAR